MISRIALALSMLSLACAAYADSENARKGHQLQFRPVSTASAGSTTVVRRTYSERHGMFRHLDIDGDGFVSKAEAAGFASVTLGFDRADRNRDGKLSFSEYDSIGTAKPAAKKVAKAKGSGSATASAGSTKKPN